MNSSLLKKSNILVLTKNPVGGIRTYLRYVYSHPSMSDFNKTLMLPCDNNVDFYSDAFDKVELEHSTSNQNINRYWFSIVKSVISKRPDIVHSHGLKTGVVLAPFLSLLRIKHLVTLHDVFSEHDFKGTKGQLKRVVLKIAFTFINVINPCGTDVGANINEYFPNIPKAKVKVIQNGINVAQFSLGETRNLKSELQINPDAVLVGYFGRFMRQKGFDILRDAVVQLNASGTRFEVACFGWGGFIREEQDELRRLQIDTQFHFLPHTDKVADSMRGLDVLIIPSRWEACPLLPMEALVAGVPVIASNCIGLRDVCQGTPCLMFESGSSEQLASVIKTFKNDQVDFLNQAKGFRNTAIERFDVAVTSSTLKAIYDNLLS